MGLLDGTGVKGLMKDEQMMIWRNGQRVWSKMGNTCNMDKETKTR